MTTFTISDVAKALQKSPRTVKRWAKAGYIPGAVQGGYGYWMVKGESLEQICSETRKNVFGFARSKGGNPRRGSNAAISKKINPPDKSTGFVSIEGVAQQFKVWQRKVEKDGFPDKWNDEQLRRVLDLHLPAKEACGAVEALLARPRRRKHRRG
jgi:hypothetical protein